MPQITKMSPAAKKITARIPTSLPGKSAWDTIDSTKLLLYGRSGTGKTTTWATFPKPILALICSGIGRPGELKSIDTPEYRKTIDPRIVTDSSEVRELIKLAAGFPTLVLDHVTGLYDLLLKEVLGIEELPAQKSWGLASQNQYGQATLQCKEILRTILNLPSNVVIVAQERVFGEEGTSDVIQPTVGAALTASLVAWLNPAVDYIAQTHIRPKEVIVKRTVGEGKHAKTLETKSRVEGQVEYCLRVGPHDVYHTKFRVPGGVKENVIIDPNYTKILSVIRAH